MPEADDYNTETTPHKSSETLQSEDTVSKSNSNLLISTDGKEDVQDEPTSLIVGPTDTAIKDELKVKIHFIAVGNAPIMKRTKFLVARTETFASLQTRLRKLITQPSTSTTVATNVHNPTPPLFMYLHTCFVPSLEDIIGQLFDLYNTNQELKVHYSLQEAWG
jgi:ubiquitin-like protein ATG12